MKSILIVCLCMWGLLVYGEKNNTVHLYGSLKEFKAAEVNMAPDGADGETIDDAAKRLLQLVIEVAGGKQTKAEEKGFREISIFKDGVVL